MLAAWLIVRGAQAPAGPACWLVAAGAVLGAAFNVKLLRRSCRCRRSPCSHGSRSRAMPAARFRALLAGGAAFVAVSLSWLVAVALAPGPKPFPIGSTGRHRLERRARLRRARAPRAGAVREPAAERRRRRAVRAVRHHRRTSRRADRGRAAERAAGRRGGARTDAAVVAAAPHARRRRIPRRVDPHRPRRPLAGRRPGRATSRRSRRRSRSRSGPRSPSWLSIGATLPRRTAAAGAALACTILPWPRSPCRRRTRPRSR